MFFFVTALSLSVNAQQNDSLISACFRGDFSKVKTLVEGGADVNYVDKNGSTPVSVSYFWPEQMQYLIDKKADPNGGSFPALISAARFYSKDVVAILLKAGADPNKPAELDLAAPMKKHSLMKRQKERRE